MNPLDEDELFKIFKTSAMFPDRLIKREDKNHEFKESFNMANAPMYLKTIAAFANNEGGYIIFGVKDKPHILQGLDDKALDRFATLPVEQFTRLLQDYFAPDIVWKNCIYEYKSLSFGIIYIYPAKVKPVICKKSSDTGNNPRYALKESDIYYRYGGRTERIKYSELQRIIDEKRAAEERQWMRFLIKATRVGVENACIMDITKGEISGTGGKIVIDEDLLKRISFIKEGEFVENGGTPTLRLVGDVETIETGKMVVAKTKNVIKAIEPTDIIEAFLKSERVENPIDYIKRICSASSGNLPVYHYLIQSGKSRDAVINDLNALTVRGIAKRTLINRLKGKCEKTRTFPVRETKASQKRKKYLALWLEENIPDFTVGEKDLNSCVEALCYLGVEQIKEHELYIKKKLFALYKIFYETSDSALAQIFRRVICYLDESLNLI